jgi:hypothetical protein
MCDGPISVAESWSATELLAAGWSEADLAWEQAAEAAAAALASGDSDRAKEEAGKALQLARENLEPIDPRLGTSLANYALCLAAAGGEGSASLLREALAVWRGTGPWIARMDAPRVARSSLFHMRMEQRHRDTYRARWQQRWAEIAAEAKARLDVLSRDSAEIPDATAAEALSRWRRERPAMLNDTRKLMAAAYLLLAPRGPGADRI